MAMAAERHLHPVDLETGEVTCPRCQHLKPGDLELAEREITRLRRLTDRLENKLAEKQEAARQGHKDRKRILELIDRWRQKTGHPKANLLATDRFDVIVSRLKEGYTFEQIELAIDGIASRPYVTKAGRQPEGKPSQRHDRLGIALGAGEDLERFANLGALARRNGLGAGPVTQGQ